MLNDIGDMTTEQSSGGNSTDMLLDSANTMIIWLKNHN